MRLFSFTVVSTIACGVVLLQPQPQDVGFIKPLTSPDPVAALIKAHGCWRSDQAPPADMAGQFPTHAIVAEKYVGKPLADQAFDQEIGGHDHGLQVSAFCK